MSLKLASIISHFHIAFIFSQVPMASLFHYKDWRPILMVNYFIIFQVSMNIVRKYIGPLDIWLSILFARSQKNGQTHCLLNSDPRKSYAAMAQHSSQWVWSVCLFSTKIYWFWHLFKKIRKEKHKKQFILVTGISTFITNFWLVVSTYIRYRKLFVAFSSCTYVNTLKQIE